MIVLLNGPKGCGKDTIANILRDKFGWLKTEFKHDLYDETAKYLNIPVEIIRERNENRTLKELPFMYKGVGYDSVRNLLIFVSEQVIKPKYGKDYFGLKAANRVKLMRADIRATPIVFADSGFEEEKLALMEKVNEPIYVVKLMREGFRYDPETDSRTYLSCPDLTIKLQENKPELAVSAILYCIEQKYGV